MGDDKGGMFNIMLASFALRDWDQGIFDVILCAIKLVVHWVCEDVMNLYLLPWLLNLLCLDISYVGKGVD